VKSKTEDIDFPVGDDPNDVNVLLYWEEVVKRMRVAMLPKDLEGWAEAIQDRIDTWHQIQLGLGEAEAAYYAEDAPAFETPAGAELFEVLTRAQIASHSAAVEFERLKWTLSQHFGRHYELDGPAVRALFAPREAGLRN
jgi:hypothetical protein